VCGVALPPDHVYCREHAGEVDDRLHQIGVLLHRLANDVPALTRLLDQVAPETWEWLSDSMGTDEQWPPPLPLQLRLHADQVEVDVASEPGQVLVDLEIDLRTWCDALREAMDATDLRVVAEACAQATGAGAAY
jgi:hypothetical protein